MHIIRRMRETDRERERKGKANDFHDYTICTVLSYVA